MSISISVAITLDSKNIISVGGDTTPGGAASAWLLEDGTSGWLLEDGTSFWLLEG